MFPIILTASHTRILLIGNGPLTQKRLSQLQKSGMKNLDLFALSPCDCLKTTAGKMIHKRQPTDAEINSAHAVYIADLPPETAHALAIRCRELNTLVNVEDVTDLCDFHTPSIVRRGDLLFSVSTNGKSPALARRLRHWLENAFPPVWAERLDKLAAMRHVWRASGMKMDEVAAKAEAAIEEEGWLK